ncbi:major facilitator superfamily domain-containing protein [Cercophora newfieldiana]|uniref:Major facilitator superfamily domain-containing protein n=1 Tax=Cercophora newfieldiana TaxID=92897 RepID=A0AA39XW17_9PEZI|nr:major facilitator superfamily domain-containing protein [Cercophora newfieldiana]
MTLTEVTDEKPGVSGSESSSSDTAAANDAATEPSTEPTYPNTFSLFLICLGLFLSVLCFGLDRTIITTAVPKITRDFNSLEDIGWYHSAYMLTSCCFQLPFGKLYAELDVKWLYLFSLVIFEVGSVLCAAAPNSVVLIVGRAIAGVGAAGLICGVFVIIAFCAPLHNRPRITGMVGGAMGVAQIIAPTLGGALTDYVSWRWCFWINLPMGAVTFVAVAFLVNIPKADTSAKREKKPKYEGLAGIARRFDLAGTAFLLPAIVSLLLALQWGGTEYAWGSWRVVLTLVVFGVAIVIWCGIQYRSGDNATVPLRIVKGRSMLSAIWFMFCIMGVLIIIVQYVTIWFQASLGISAYQSGVNLLATSVPMSFTFIAAGFLTSKIGYYVPQMIGCTILSSVATGMITRFSLETSKAYWIVSLLLTGIGIGLGAQQPLTIPQVVLTNADVSLGTSVVIFSQTLSGTVWVSVANNIFHDRLVSELTTRVPTVDPDVVVAAGANGIAETLGHIYPDEIGAILKAYDAALGHVWIIIVSLACLSVFGLFTEWKSVKQQVSNAAKVEEGAGGDGKDTQNKGNDA